MLRKLEGPPHNIHPAEEMLRKLWNLFLCVRCCLNHHLNNSFSQFSPFHHKKMRQNHHHRFTHCLGCNPFQSRWWTIKFILDKNWNTKFKSPRFYGQNHHITVVFLGKSPSPHLIKITKLPRILDQNRPITRYFWIQSPNTKNTRPPPLWQSIIVELITKHRCRSTLASTTMLSKFNNDALYSKQSIVVVKVYGP